MHRVEGCKMSDNTASGDECNKYDKKQIRILDMSVKNGENMKFCKRKIKRYFSVTH